MDVKITGIGDKNIEYFRDILPPLTGRELCFGAIADGAPAGAAAISLYDDVAELESIFVAEEYRRKGIASELLSTISDKAKENDISAVSAVYANDPAMSALFGSAGFTTTPGSTYYSVNIGTLLDTDSVKKYGGTAMSGKQTLSELDRLHRGQLYDMLRDSGFEGGSEIIEDSDEGISFVSTNKKGDVTGCILASLVGRDVFVNLLYVKEKESYQTSVGLIAALILALEPYRVDMEYLRFQVISESVRDVLYTVCKEEDVKEETLTESALKLML